MKALFTFDTTADALNSERVFRAGGVTCTVTPVPRSLQACCNYAVEAEGADAAALVRMLRAGQVDFAGVFRAVVEAGNGRYEKIEV